MGRSNEETRRLVEGAASGIEFIETDLVLLQEKGKLGERERENCNWDF